MKTLVITLGLLSSGLLLGVPNTILMPNTPDSLVEVSEFKVTSGTTTEALVTAVERMNAVLEATPGYQSRELVYHEETNTWIDLVHWSSLEAAQAAMESVMSHPEAQAFLSLIDMETVRMRHAHTHWASAR